MTEKSVCICRNGLRSTHCEIHGFCTCCHGASCPTHDEPEQLIPWTNYDENESQFFGPTDDGYSDDES